MKIAAIALILTITMSVAGQPKMQANEPRQPLPSCVVGTGLTRCYDNRSEIAPPKAGQPFYGQDAQYQAVQPAYKDNGDGTVTDLNTGLTWIQKPPTDKYSWTDAAKVVAGLNSRNFAGHGDWRLPNTKELYSIINHSKGWPYIDTKFFVCELSPQVEDQVKNTQYWSSDKSVTAGGRTEAFGVNFATGHIKAYAIGMWSYVRCVRGNADHGKNDFVDNKDQTIADRATGLMWSKEDSRKGLNWEEALAWAATKNQESYLGHNDWRLPNVKEMQSIVDYGRIPDAANATNVGTAINPLFSCTPITNQEGATDCPYYWTSTSCYHGPASPEYRFAWYVSFGRAKSTTSSDGPGGGPRGHLVAEAGAIRYDAKVKGGGGGPGGGGERIYNYVRLVRGGNVAFAAAAGTVATTRPAIAEPKSTPAPVTPAGPGGGFQLIRPFASVKMNLTEDQLKQIAELEKEAKTKLDKILTPEQQKTLQEARPPRPGQGQGRPGTQGGQSPTGGPSGAKRTNDGARVETPPGDTASDIAPVAMTKPSASASVPSTPPNVLVIIVDDLGWGDVSYHKGTLSTPNIDRLAKDGVELARFYAYPVCSPTRAALITGQMPRRYGIVTPLGPRQAGIPTGIPTLPGTFQLAGYQTSLIGKWHIGTTSPPNKSGFDHFYGFMGPQVDYFKHTNQAGGIDWQRDGETVNEEGYSTFLLADEAIHQIEHRDPKRPFFFEVAFNAPHFPLSAPEKYLAKHKDLGGRATYAAIVDALDVSIGRVLAVLDKQGLRDNTLVLFFSDNGAGPREGGSNGVLRSGKGSVYEGGIRTPCIVRWPGHVPQGTVSQQPVSTQDLFPTLAAATGVPMPAGAKLDGKNMWPALREGRVVPRDPFLIATTDIALIDSDWKLIETQDGQQSLYHISSDISETTDLIKREPETARRLIAKLAELKKDLPATTQRPGPGSGAGPGGGRGRPGGPPGAAGMAR